MALDRIKIGARIRKIRDEIYQETRAAFAERCGFTENYLGKLERGEASISTKTLDKVCSAVGTTPNYILYGDSTNKNLSIRNTILTDARIIARADAQAWNPKTDEFLSISTGYFRKNRARRRGD